MVSALSIRSDCDGDADNAEEHEDESPPCEVWEAAVNGGYYGADKGDDPGKLWQRSVREGAREGTVADGQERLTMPMEIVARAKGSPTMRPKLKPDDLWP